MGLPIVCCINLGWYSACCRCIEVWSCCACEAAFCSDSGLRVHFLSHASGNHDHIEVDGDKCWNCNTLYTSHRIYKTSRIMYICAHCDACVTERKELELHIKIVHNVSNHTFYVCKLRCNKLFDTPQDIMKHVREKHELSDIKLSEFEVKGMSDITFTCGKCLTPCILSSKCSSCTAIERKVKLPANCKSHGESHVCFKCDLKFEDCSNLWTHIYSEHKTSTNQVQCNLCPASCSQDFRQPSLLIRHMKRSHKKKLVLVDEAKMLRQKCRVVEDGKERFQCPYCAQRLGSFWGLKEHIHIHTGEKSHTCTICQKKFRFKTRLNTHYKSVHENMRKHQCVYCGHTFNEKSNLNVHMRIHTGEKKYVCEQCGASFAQWAGLYNHKFTHKDSKFPCTHCERAYSLPSDLQKHIKTHTENRVYVCDVCGKVFKTAKNMRRHTKIHISDRQFICGVCNAMFKLKKYLTQHYKVHLKKSM
uniref:Zinc finger protein 26 n=1 Tax=Cacopsylla melanoneura TaxID=428564 RepID=A0A8D8XL12_9HEMI